jgi:hypothetical protein
MAMLGISPAVDFAFLKTFGDPVNRGPVIGFLNSVLKSAHPTVDVTVETPFSFPEFAAHKLSILDLNVVDSAGKLNSGFSGCGEPRTIPAPIS